MTTVKGDLHPSIQEFKEFVRQHPKMVHDVRNGKKSWQQFYEEWYLLGEQDKVWNHYKVNGETISSSVQEDHEEKSEDFMGQMVSFFKKLDVDQVQQHLANMTTALGSVQQVIQQFQGNRATKQQRNSENNPFFFQKD
ncbi:YlbD family protein [Bacillus rhizoplanae]|uniref:YlbD family protein n=1 Tax=Bacillus rhizoplanae TaxID=2880966 RepID=UPI003D25E370